LDTLSGASGKDIGPEGLLGAKHHHKNHNHHPNLHHHHDGGSIEHTSDDNNSYQYDAVNIKIASQAQREGDSCGMTHTSGGSLPQDSSDQTNNSRHSGENH